MEIIIDATDLIAGRLATYAAKEALMGKTVKIINSEKAVISGSPRRIIDETKYKKHTKGASSKGPYYSKLPDRFLRRLIRGMLPYKKPRGAEAFKRIMCYIGVPAELNAENAITIKEANVNKLPDLQYVSIGRLCEELGGKHYG